MSFEAITYGVADAVATITLNRPDKLNPLSSTMVREIDQAFQQAGEDPSVRAIMLTGTGRAFSAGADLTEGFGGQSDLSNLDVGRALEERYNPLILRMRAMAKPIIGAVNGIAAGAGCNLALACDITVAAKSAKFIQIFARIGLVPDAGGTYFLPRLVGMQRAMAASMLAEDVPAEDAARWGMIWKVFPDDSFAEEARAFAVHLASRPTRTMGFIKEALYASAGNDLARQLHVERELQREAGRTNDFREGVMAFLQKRPANFTGE